MNVLLCGACGKMGRNVAEAVKQAEGMTVVCGVDLFPSPMPFPVYKSFADVTESVDVIIDFSSVNGLAERLAYCKAKNIGIVLASTGYSEEDLKLIAETSKVIPVFQTGNFSLGVNLLQILVKRAAEVLGDGFDVEIIEKHHNQKKDAPSGTALMLANSVNEGYHNGKEFLYGREGMVGARKQSEVCIHAVRGGTIVGEHEVMFAGQDEIITLSHSARSRMIFATGAVKAAAWLVGKTPGKYDMTDLFNDIL